MIYPVAVSSVHKSGFAAQKAWNSAEDIWRVTLRIAGESRSGRATRICSKCKGGFAERRGYRPYRDLNLEQDVFLGVMRLLIENKHELSTGNR